MKIENVEVFGFKAALRGMRNPMESWERSDTVYGYDNGHTMRNVWNEVFVPEHPLIGPRDMKLACSLIRAGRSHRKFLRQIVVWWDITIPRAIWQEFDTYKVSTVRNSCSTMHKLGHRDLELSDFEDSEIEQVYLTRLNQLAATYRLHKTRHNLHRLKMYLPEAFLQKSTYSFNYETALNMYFDRRDHWMREWSGTNGICDWIECLPYMERFIESRKGKKLSDREES